MKKRSILLIEDDADNRHLVRFMLEQEGYEVIEAFDGRDGLEKAKKIMPDLVLLDMSIPEIDGWKLASQLKKDEITHSLCVVALTGHTMAGDRQRALDAGCDGYISKPLDVHRFASQVLAFFDQPIENEEEIE